MFLLASLLLTLRLSSADYKIQLNFSRWTIKTSKDPESIEINACIFSTIENRAVLRCKCPLVLKKLAAVKLNRNTCMDSRHCGDCGSLVHTYRNYELICVFDKNSNIRITSN